MERSYTLWKVGIAFGVAVLFCAGSALNIAAAPLPGGTLNPLRVPKYVTPLVIPPVMKSNGNNETGSNSYDIAVRQFRQQILPGGIWNKITGRKDGYRPTKVWGYGAG